MYPDGSIELASAITSNRQNTALGRLGYVMEFPKTLDDVSYYGRGPVENYNDRMACADIGTYTSPAAALTTEYTFPQENGNHEGTRWLTFSKGRSGASIIATVPRSAGADGTLASQREMPNNASAAPALSFNVSPWSAVDLTLAAHPYQLPEREHYFLTLDAKVTGLGGNSCGQGAPLTIDRALAEPTQFGFLIRPLGAKGGTAVSGSTPMPTMPVIPKPEGQLEVVYASSIEPSEGSAEAFADGDPSTFWHSMWSITVGTYPHWVDFDAGKQKTICCRCSPQLSRISLSPSSFSSAFFDSTAKIRIFSQFLSSRPLFFSSGNRKKCDSATQTGSSLPSVRICHHRE